MAATLDLEETIVARATAPGPGLRGLIRLSGPRAWAIAQNGFTPDVAPGAWRGAELHPGTLSLEGLRPALPVIIGLWAGPRSYTGQDVAEIHLPGSEPLVDLVLSACLSRGARHAEPGEFTLRAFLSGRIDLTRAEAVLGVIDAASPAQLETALRQLAGGLSSSLSALRERLLDLVAHLEANLDFVEEADVDAVARAALSEELETAAGGLASLTDRLRDRDRSGNRPRAVLLGPPNAGKSRLFNAMCDQELALVSPAAGTTRDYLTGLCACGAISVELIDTAGIEPPRDGIEDQARALREEVLQAAEVILLCSSIDAPADRVELETGGRSEAVIRVRTKADLANAAAGTGEAWVLTSAATGEGLDDLRATIERVLGSSGSEGDLVSSTAARSRDSLTRAREVLAAAAQTFSVGGGDELVVMDLRAAIDELGKVLGVSVTDDILDRIFTRFCIGK